jgi:hypothetical protein
VETPFGRSGAGNPSLAQNDKEQEMATADTSRAPGPSDRTPAQLYSLIFGATLLLAGILGFIADSSFGDLGSGVSGDELVLFEVNGWHNIVHIASGIVGLAMAGKPSTARLFALGFGSVYLLVTLIGLIDGDSIFGLLAINAADNVLHLVIALAGIAAGLASAPAGADSRARTA